MDRPEMAVSGKETALIVPVRLPEPLEILRRRCIPDARHGLPAHATLLYPFVEPGALDEGLRSRLAAIVAGHARFPFQLAGRARWPATLFASVEPEDPFRSLYEDLAAAFPDFPIYRGAYRFVPHVTVAEGPAAVDPAVVDDPAWGVLPVTRLASVTELIVWEADAWKPWWRFDLGIPRAGA
jgi:2'-5' RNA ligase